MRRIKPYCPLWHGGPRVNDRRIVSGIIFVSGMACGGATRLRRTGRQRRSTTASFDGAGSACSIRSSALAVKGGKPMRRAAPCRPSSSAAAPGRSMQRGCGPSERSRDPERSRRWRWRAAVDAGYLHQPAAKLSLPRTGHDPAIIFEDLLLHHAQLGSQHLQAHACVGRHPLIRRIGNDVEQMLDAVSANRRHDAELGKVRPQCVRQLRSLAVEDQANTVKHHRTLLLRGFDTDEAHGRPCYRLADRLGIGRVVLAPLDVRFHNTAPASASRHVPALPVHAPSSATTRMPRSRPTTVAASRRTLACPRALVAGGLLPCHRHQHLAPGTGSSPNPDRSS
jgi:hypothetical protein